MTILCEPMVYYPEHVITNEDTIFFLDELHPDTPNKEKAFRMIRNSTIEKRHLILPLDKTIELGDFGERATIYSEEARKQSTLVSQQAIKKSGAATKDISMVIVTSCTGFMMPSLTAHLINSLKLSNSTIQLPIAQMGCAAGASAINRAYEHCQQNSSNNVLIVALETASLCFHREANRLQDFITNSLFGDGVAAVVMKGDDNGSGFKLSNTQSHFMNNSEEYITYSITSNGFHFSLDKDVMHSISKVAPKIVQFIEDSFDKKPHELDSYIFHTGGKRILDEVERCLSLNSSSLDNSRNCLRDTGNTSSVAVIDVLKRHFKQRKVGGLGVLVAFGPGFTTEMSAGEWV
ncbi:type III polyketide synthase [Shewanella psychropiezotolerans]|uniref:Type III polyketide synthase n=1 Tax=Shewanella psychropiezotolerans TaxID=2593655 RepID=A0ABX5X321_9GAMM|nr:MULTISPECIES: type III polyketide synthase [Shewanella]MPY24081.1 type III polyketide synthase [Shewanella sp. YLB-07]QDO84328.1 type III polyketide synthase [Shewanella psychropiezotolerans]